MFIFSSKKRRIYNFAIESILSDNRLNIKGYKRYIKKLFFKSKNNILVQYKIVPLDHFHQIQIMFLAVYLESSYIFEKLVKDFTITFEAINGSGKIILGFDFNINCKKKEYSFQFKNLPSKLCKTEKDNNIWELYDKMLKKYDTIIKYRLYDKDKYDIDTEVNF